MEKIIRNLLGKLPVSWIKKLDADLKAGGKLSFPFSSLEPDRETVEECLDVFLAVEEFVAAKAALPDDWTGSGSGSGSTEMIGSGSGSGSMEMTGSGSGS